MFIFKDRFEACLHSLKHSADGSNEGFYFVL